MALDDLDFEKVAFDSGAVLGKLMLTQARTHQHEFEINNQANPQFKKLIKEKRKDLEKLKEAWYNYFGNIQVVHFDSIVIK